MLLAATIAFSSHAADWTPTSTVKMMVPAGVGTGSDTIARMLAPGLTEALGQPIVVENLPGAGGALGLEQATRAPADGHTIVLGANGMLIAGPLLKPSVKYRTERDFVPIAGVARSAFAIVTANTPTGPKTIKELVAQIKDTPANYGSSGLGTVTHLASELFLFRAGVKATHVPYKASGQSLTDVIAGHVLFVSDTLPAVLPLVRSGKLRALAVTSGTRVSALPDVPTLVESGFPDLVAEAWWGLLAPAGIPPKAVEALGDSVSKALRTPNVQARIKSLELEGFCCISCLSQGWRYAASLKFEVKDGQC